MSLMGAIPNAPVRLAIVDGRRRDLRRHRRPADRHRRCCACSGDYLAIVTLAFGEIIKELINCLIIGYDENGLHFIFNPDGNKTVDDLGLSASGSRHHQGRAGCDRHRHDRHLHRGLHPRS